jgi:hypothetical protein
MSASTTRRRSRGEIDRRFLLADIFRKTGGAVLLLVALIAAGTPFTVREALSSGLTQYVAIMGGFAAVGVALFLAGRALRRNATHWDTD